MLKIYSIFKRAEGALHHVEQNIFGIIYLQLLRLSHISAENELQKMLRNFDQSHPRLTEVGSPLDVNFT